LGTIFTMRLLYRQAAINVSLLEYVLYKCIVQYSIFIVMHADNLVFIGSVTLSDEVP
jgi:hypothetical protein